MTDSPPQSYLQQQSSSSTSTRNDLSDNSRIQQTTEDRESEETKIPLTAEKLGVSIDTNES